MLLFSVRRLGDILPPHQSGPRHPGRHGEKIYARDCHQQQYASAKPQRHESSWL
jgi:hypothetical protein